MVERLTQSGDELLAVLSNGELLAAPVATLELRDRDLWVREGEFAIIPRGVEHMPVAEEETHIVLLEPKTTRNTGNVQDAKTVAHLERI